MDMTGLPQLGMTPGNFLLQIAQQAVVGARGSSEEAITYIKGELRFGIKIPEGMEGEGTAWSSAELLRIGLISSGVRAEPDEITEQSETGRISIYNTLDSGGSVTESGQGLHLRIDATVEMLYERLLYQQLWYVAEGSAALEEQRGVQMRFTLDGQLTPVEEPEYKNQVARFSGTLALARESDDESVIDSIDVDIEAAPIYRDGEATDLSLRQKRILVQPIIFADHEGGTNDDIDDDVEMTLLGFQAQLDRANQLWNPGCVQFVMANLEPEVIPNATLKVSDDVVEIGYSAYLDANGTPVFSAGSNEPVNIIEVFLVRNQLADDVGGATLKAGSGLDKVVISDGIIGHNNPQLLAHELGHVVRLLHPGATSSSFASGEPGTDGSIMEDLTDLFQNHPAINTLANCRNADNPAKVLIQPPIYCTQALENWEVEE